MILVFGGTTEGLVVAKLLDFIGEQYYYSTKIKGSWGIGGKLIWGEMDVERLSDFCTLNSINLIIDAAHPFAVILHDVIHRVVGNLNIKNIRYERIFPSVQKNNTLIKYFNSYNELNKSLIDSDFNVVLFLTGAQTIQHFKEVREQTKSYFRILNTSLSKQNAKNSGISDEYIIPMHPDASVDKLNELITLVQAEVIVSKESGASGFFQSKVKASKNAQIPLWVLKRPVLPKFNYTVYSKKELLQVIYQLRKTVLKSSGKLREGYTTGTCVLASVKACFFALMNGCFPDMVEVELPNSVKAKFIVFKEYITSKKAACVVIKDGGDDPDVTHGKEIGCELSVSKNVGFHFFRGKGVGVVTLPGLPVCVGEPAINPVPRKMIVNMLNALLFEYNLDVGYDITPFVPEGEELAAQTFNLRIGVIGGISIIGTSGRVIPYSNEAFLSSIKSQLLVAIETDNSEIVITSGQRSENMVRNDFLNLSQQAFIHFGNLIGKTIELAVNQGVKKINLAIMFGKGIKLAEGHLDTHSKNVVFNPNFAAHIARQCGVHNDVCEKIQQQKIANAILKLIPFTETNIFYITIAKLCYETCSKLLPGGYHLNLILLSNEGDKIVYS